MKKQQDPIKELRKLINDGFKEYDGDIREEALEALDLVEKIYKTATSNFDTQANDVDDLTKENAILKTRIANNDSVVARLNSELAHAISICDFHKIKCEALEKLNNELAEELTTLNLKFVGISAMSEIDFGTAKIYYAIQSGGVCVINEVMKALKDAAQVVPLTELLTAIKRSPSFPRI